MKDGARPDKGSDQAAREPAWAHRLAVRKVRCYTVGMRDRFFFPLCAAAAIAMIVLAIIGPGAPDSPPARPAGQTQEKTQ